MRLILVHPSRLAAEGLADVLSRRFGFDVIGTFATAEGALDSRQRVEPEVAVVEFDAPRRQGIEQVEQLRRFRPDLRILVTGVPDLEADALSCIEAGASGFLFQNASLEDLRAHIEATARGESICPPRIVGIVFDRLARATAERAQLRSLDLVRLTPRELEVLRLVDGGLTNKEIAAALSIELQTVKNHVHNLLDKLQLDGRRDAARFAREQGLLEEAPAGEGTMSRVVPMRQRSSRA